MIYLSKSFPLISVIIPTYNYGHFITKAINSVRNQTYTNWEIIIIDDGSSDDTKSIVKESSDVIYYYQNNQGLAAARNTGIKKSKGDYLVFLDADDWLENEALEQNFLAIKDQPQIAFVSGNYYLLRVDSNECKAVSATVSNDHYTHLLRSNYIGMHAAVMFQKWAFSEVRYDELLPSCEDYDLYLRMARLYPVLHHQKFIATYNFHTQGLSHNYQKMIDSIIIVIRKQLPFLRSAEERKAYKEGLQQWKEYDLLLQESK